MTKTISIYHESDKINENLIVKKIGLDFSVDSKTPETPIFSAFTRDQIE